MPKEKPHTTDYRDGATDTSTFFKYHDNDAVAVLTVGTKVDDDWSVYVKNKSSGPISGNLVFRNESLDSEPMNFSLGPNESDRLTVEDKYVSKTAHYFVNVDEQNIREDAKRSQVERR